MRRRNFTPGGLRVAFHCSAKPSARKSPNRSRNGSTIEVQPATTAPGGAGNKQPLANDIVTEQSAARQFADEHGDQVRYCRSARQWFFWNGVIWIRDERGIAYHWAGQLSSRLGEDQNAATRKNLGRAAFANGVEKFAQHDPRLVMTADGWNSDPMLLGTPGGTVDLQTGELRTSRREDYITKMTERGAAR